MKVEREDAVAVVEVFIKDVEDWLKGPAKSTPSKMRGGFGIGLKPMDPDSEKELRDKLALLRKYMGKLPAAKRGWRQ